MAKPRPTCCMPVVSHLPFDARVWKQARSLAEVGWAVRLIGMSYDAASVTTGERDGIAVTEIPFGSRGGVGVAARLRTRAGALLRLWWQVLRTRADVYHCHNIHPVPAVLAAARSRRARIVYDAHELYGEPVRDASPLKRLTARCARLAERLIARRADAVITTNESRAALLRERHRLDRVTVLRNVPALAEAEPRRLGVAENRRVLLYQGGVYARARAFEATIRALVSLPEFDLVIVGFGRETDLAQLREWASEADVAERVHLRDPLPFGQLIGTAASATVGLVPLRAISTNSVLGDTNKLYEYLMGGLPVAGSDFPEVRRVLRAGEPPVGEVFDPEDPSSIAAAVRRVAGDGYEARRAEARRQAVELHNWELEQRKLLALYRDLAPTIATPPDADPVHIRTTLTELDAWGEAREWIGSDPYEGLNAKVAAMARGALARRALIQTVKRSPLDPRPLLGIAPRPSSAALAHVLSATVRMARAGVLSLDEGAARVERLVATLRELQTSDHAGSAWGYPFDMRSRFFFYAAGTPNTIATSFAGLALLDAHALTGSTESLELAQGAGDFLLAEVPQTAAEIGAYFGYLPTDSTPVHNANLLACSLLASLEPATGREDFARAARAGVAYAVAHQRDDGSWPYAGDARGDWVDGLHTGYVLDGLLVCAVALGFSGARAAHRRGLDYYARNLIAGDGAAKAFDRSLYPIDGQYVAQAIRSFTLAAALDRARLETAARVYEFAMRRMRRRDGAFVFQRHRRWVNPIPHVRWVQAPMLDALSMLYEAQAPAPRSEAIRLPGAAPAKVG
ncbi:MAG TPA: glycosyltransferase [Solirubrobacterales bacterium]|nr:glycosyltransferase [Solirubrobacterales bacterium]